MKNIFVRSWCYILAVLLLSFCDSKRNSSLIDLFQSRDIDIQGLIGLGGELKIEDLSSSNIRCYSLRSQDTVLNVTFIDTQHVNSTIKFKSAPLKSELVIEHVTSNMGLIKNQHNPNSLDTIRHKYYHNDECLFEAVVGDSTLVLMIFRYTANDSEAITPFVLPRTEK